MRIPRFGCGVTPVNSKLFCGEKLIFGAFLSSREQQFIDWGVFFFDMVKMDEKLFELCLKLCV